jgi:hypothetical protein
MIWQQNVTSNGPTWPKSLLETGILKINMEVSTVFAFMYALNILVIKMKLTVISMLNYA